MENVIVGVFEATGEGNSGWFGNQYLKIIVRLPPDQTKHKMQRENENRCVRNR